jgi:hypothetical protein
MYGNGSAWRSSSSTCRIRCDSGGRSERSARRNPFHVLSGYLGNTIVVFIVMPEDRSRRFGGGSDEEVRDLDAAVVEPTLLGQPVLNLKGSLELIRAARKLMESEEFGAELLVVGGATGRVQDLQANLRASGKSIGRQPLLPSRRNRRMRCAMPGAGIGKVKSQRCHRRLASSTSSPRSIPSPDRTRLARRRRRSARMTSSKARSIVSLIPVVPSARWAPLSRSSSISRDVRRIVEG